MTTIYDKLRSSLFEVQEPLSQGEKNFKGMHNPINHKDIVPGITDQDHIFNGTKRREDPKTASYEKGKDIAAYDKNLKKEEVEQVDEISDRLARSYDKVASKSMDDAAAKGSAGYDTFMKRSKGRALALDKMNQPHKRLKAKVGTTDANAKDAAYRKSVGEELVSEGNPMNKEKKNAAAAAVGAKNKDSQYLSRMNPSVADKIRGREKMSGKDRQQYEEVEQVDELSSGVYKSAMNKAAKRAVSDVQGKSGPIHTKYAPMARKFQAKGMEQEKKEKAVKEEVLDENITKMSDSRLKFHATNGVPHGSFSKKEISDEHARRKKTGGAEYAAVKPSMNEEALDEISKKLAARYNNKVAREVNKNQNSGGDPAKILKRKNREAGHKLSWNKYHNYKVKVPATNEEVEQVDEVITKKTSLSTVISDFVHSKNPKFDGKSKKQRMKQAMAAYYSKQRSESYVAEEDDWEGQMAKTELSAIRDKASKLIGMLNDQDNLEAWVQSKISQAKMQIDSVHDYLVYGDEHKTPATSDYDQSGKMASSYGNFMNRMGEETELDEAKRGRPRKNASTSDSDVEGGADMHPIMQARKAISLRGQHTFTHKSGESYKMEPSTAHKVIAHHDNLKTTGEKQEFADRVAHSKDEMHRALAGKPAIKKPKISLGGSVKKESTDVTTMRADRGPMNAQIRMVDGKMKVVKTKGRRKEIDITSEELKGGQKNLDKNHNGRLDKMDFKLLRKKKKVMEAEEMNCDSVAKAAATQTEFGAVGNRNMQQDSVDKISKDSQASKMKIKLPPTQGNKPIGGDTQTHPNVAEETLTRLYDTLSEDNKAKFKEMLETDNGIEKLLDFAREQGI